MCKPLTVSYLLSTETSYGESDLLAQIAAGNETAFRKVFDLYKDRFYGVAHKMTRSDVAAQEIVQETFVALWKNRAAVAEVRKESSYLFSIFYRCLYAYCKKEAKERLMKKSFEAVVQVDEAADVIELEGKYELMEKAIASLPPQQAMVYKLSKVEGLSRDQVAERMGISPNTVRNHLADAMKALRSFVRQAGIWAVIVEECFK